MNMTRYFLALIPDEPLATAIHKIKLELNEDYGTKGALRSPAHITLHMPFLWKEKKEEELFYLLAQTTNQKKFSIQLNGFGAFEPKTIFIKNDFCQPLMDFQAALTRHTWREMKLFNPNHNKGFHPHITIAFRDLKKEAFYKAWPLFEHREFKATFYVNSFWLLKHDGHVWHAHKKFSFNYRI